MKVFRFVLVTLLTFVSFIALIDRSNLRKVLAMSLSKKQIAEYINRERLKHNIPPLRLDEQLSEAAYKKGIDMLQKNYWNHFGPNGESPWTFIVQSGYDYTYAGENLAKGFSNPYDVVLAWMASPAHRENLLDKDFEDLGIAIVYGTLQGKPTHIIVALFGTKSNHVLAYKKRPMLAFVQPQEGDILTSGVVDIKIKAKNIMEQKVNLFLEQTFLKTLSVDKEQHTIQDTISLPEGRITLYARARGLNDEPLMDFVHFFVSPKQRASSDLGNILSIRKQGDNLVIDWTSSSKNVESLYFECKGQLYQVDKMPYVSPFPSRCLYSTMHFVIFFKDGRVVELNRSLEDPSQNNRSILSQATTLSRISQFWREPMESDLRLFSLTSVLLFLVSIIGIFIGFWLKAHFIFWDVLVVDIIYLTVLGLLNVTTLEI